MAERYSDSEASGTGALSGIQQKKEQSAARLTAYVDGSFSEPLGKYAFGCILLPPGGEAYEVCGSGSEPESLAIRNVAGEMLGAMYAVQWAINQGYAALDLYYDYQGIEAWATGAWKAKQPLTQKYAAFMQEKRQFLQLRFCKVKAHSGDPYNERVDKLAKRALTETDGIPKVPRRQEKPYMGLGKSVS